LFFIGLWRTFGIIGPEGQGLFLKAEVAAVFAAIPTSCRGWTNAAVIPLFMDFSEYQKYRRCSVFLRLKPLLSLRRFQFSFIWFVSLQSTVIIVKML
jgi:hypothetical protein